MFADILIAVIWQKWNESENASVSYGHADIGVTLNTYTHLGAEDAREELGKFAKMA